MCLEQSQRAGSISDLLRAHARARPHAEFVCFEAADGTTWRATYAEFDRNVDVLAASLESAGVRTGDSFLVRMRNHPVALALILAASRTGTVAVPVDPALSLRETTLCVELARCAMSVERDPALVMIADLPVWHLEELTMNGRGNPAPTCCDVRANAPAGVVEFLFTSGTTSRPKAVMVTDASLLHGADVLSKAAAYDASDVPLITLSLFHAAAQTHQLWPTLFLGGRVVLVERFSASRFSAQAARHGATTSAQFAASLRMLLRRGHPTPNGNLRHVTFAQNLTESEYVEWQDKFGIPLQQLWGMTETVGLPIMSPLTGDRRLDAMGKVVDGYEIDIVTTSDPIPNGNQTIGELRVRASPGRNVALGYYQDPTATAALMRDGWLWSGDIVRQDPDGWVQFVGRHGDIIRRAGVNFSALEVEEVIRSVRGVVDAAVVALPDPIYDARVVAAIVVARSGDVTVDALRAQCSERLAAYKRPEAFHFVDELPRTSVGKIRRHILAAALAAAAPELPSSA